MQDLQLLGSGAKRKEGAWFRISMRMFVFAQSSYFPSLSHCTSVGVIILSCQFNVTSQFPAIEKKRLAQQMHILFLLSRHHHSADPVGFESISMGQRVII